MNKKIKSILYIILPLFYMTVNTSQAQISTGTALLGGNGSFVSGSTGKNEDKISTTTLNLQPNYGKFISDNICIGARAIFNTNSEKTASASSKSTNQAYGLGVFGRYYYRVYNKAYVFGEASPRYVMGASKMSGSTTKTTTGTLTVQAGLGVAYFIADNLSLDMSYLFGKSFQSTKIPDSPKISTDFGQNNFFLGLQFYLK